MRLLRSCGISLGSITVLLGFMKVLDGFYAGFRALYGLERFNRSLVHHQESLLLCGLSSKP